MNGNRYKALVIDDDPLFHEFFEFKFNNILEITSIKNEAKAKLEIKKEEYDLILVDLNLNPDNEGLEGLKLISRSINAPIIAVTSIQEATSLSKAQNLGAKRGLYKEEFELWRPIISEVISESKQMNNNSYNTADCKALVMMGGGIKGLSYVGAIKELQKKHDFNCFVGTSAGAIAAVLLAADFSVKELREIMSSKDFTDFFDASWLRMPINAWKNNAFFRGDHFTNWLEHLLADKLNSSTQVKLGDLPKRLVVYASTKDKEAIVFDSIKEKYKDRPAAFAVRCSMSIPWVFKAQEIDGKKVYDGGLQNNYPAPRFIKDNEGAEFVGLFLGPEIYEGEAKNTSTAKDVYDIAFDAQSQAALKQYKEETVVIDVRPITTLKFKLTEDEKQFLIDKGSLSAKRFLNKNNRKLNSLQKDIEKRRKALIDKQKRKKRKRQHVIVISIALIVVIFLFKYFF